MPPKKKKGKGKKKKSSSELTEDDKYKKSLYEIDALKDNLAFRKEFSRRTKAAYEDMKMRMDENSVQLDDMENNHRSANAYLTHQYKTLQTDMGLKIHTLENELNVTKRNLENCEDALQETVIEKKKMLEEKDEKISELQSKIESIEMAYDSIIQTNLDNFIGSLNKAKTNWETNSIKIQAKNKKLLAELGLNIHDI
jgi:hypothetical protein